MKRTLVLVLLISGCASEPETNTCDPDTYIHRILESQQYSTIATVENKPSVIGGAAYIAEHQAHILKVKHSQDKKDNSSWLRLNPDLLEK